MDKVLEKIIIDVSKKYSVDPKEVERVLNSPYKMMREYIQKLELKGKTFEECEGMKTNFNMPVLFKAYLNQYKLNELNGREPERDSDCCDG